MSANHGGIEASLPVWLGHVRWIHWDGSFILSDSCVSGLDPGGAIPIDGVIVIMARYRLICDNDKLGMVALKGSTVAIGRHPNNDVVLEDNLASRFHCVIEPGADGGYMVRDLGSRNGTRLNDQRIDESPFAEGDALRIGGHVFHIEHEGPVPKKSNDKPSEKQSRWSIELLELINLLPPKDELEDITLIDAMGNVSDALMGKGGGAIATRLLLLAASKSRATDIHIEPKSEAYGVRMRVDGQMLSIVKLPKQVGELIEGLIKAVCQMKAAGRGVVQEGHYSATINARRVDYRASFSPSVHGQKLVLRVLDGRETPRSLTDLGMPGYMLERIRHVCEQSSGMLIVVGPTGSGKTTTLYNCMRTLDVERRNVITIEDPVEYHISGITQIPADEAKGNSFGALLRSVLRQDPDVILVGEVRDDETARTAMQAAMTGHVVFSTLHARDTIASVFRLLDLGVEPYLVANSLNLVLAQRLVRVLCDKCKRAVELTPGQATRLGRFAKNRKVYSATGCAECMKTGYRGRMAIFELLEFNDEMRDIVLNNPSIQSMRKIAEAGLFTTLAQSGWQLVSRGKTSVEEVDHVVGGL